MDRRDYIKKQEDTVNNKTYWISPATSIVGQAETLMITEKLLGVKNRTKEF